MCPPSSQLLPPDNSNGVNQILSSHTRVFFVFLYLWICICIFTCFLVSCVLCPPGCSSQITQIVSRSFKQYPPKLLYSLFCICIRRILYLPLSFSTCCLGGSQLLPSGNSRSISFKKCPPRLLKQSVGGVCVDLL